VSADKLSTDTVAWDKKRKYTLNFSSIFWTNQYFISNEKNYYEKKAMLCRPSNNVYLTTFSELASKLAADNLKFLRYMLDHYAKYFKILFE
jgi:hypothetical protein